MRCSRLTFIALAFVAATANAQFQPPNQPTTQSTNQSMAQPGMIEAEPGSCMVVFINRVDVASQVQGTITEIKFEEGTNVAMDDTIAVVDDRMAKMNLELKKAEEEEAILNATNEVQLIDAKNSQELADAELEAFKSLRKEGAIPYWELKKKELEAKRAKLKIGLSEMQIKIAKAQYFAKRAETRIAEAEIERRYVKAPFEGFVESRLAQLGEWAQPGTPVATLVQMDKLRVQGEFDSKRYLGKVKKGSVARISIKNTTDGDPILIDARIGFVSSEIDINDKFRVWADFDNIKQDGEWQIKPGMKAEIVIRP